MQAVTARLGVVLALSLLAGCSEATAGGNWRGAGDRVGEVATVCGPVVSVGSAGGDTFVNVGEDYPSPGRFTIVVREAVGPALRTRHSELVCVTGRVTRHQGSAQIVVPSPRHLVFE